MLLKNAHPKNPCENSDCFMPEKMLKAWISHKLDIPLEICYPVTKVDSKLLTEGLMSVFDFTISDYCECKVDGKYDKDSMILTREQNRELFESLEKRSDMIEFKYNNISKKNMHCRVQIDLIVVLYCVCQNLSLIHI